MNEHEFIHEMERRKLWCSVAIAVAGSNDCKHLTTPHKYADAVLCEFDERFKVIEFNGMEEQSDN